MWQPIETVPKDGSRVLVFTSSGVVEVVYMRCEVCEDSWWLDWHVEVVEASYHDNVYLTNKPTHWMPLPLPPEEKD